MTADLSPESWRDRLLKRIEVLMRDDIAEQASAVGFEDPDIVATWKRSREILSVEMGGVELFPAFQFDNARPRPSIAEALRALPAGFSTTQIVNWFLARDPALGGRAPVDVLDDTDAVISAAHREARYRA